MQRSTMSKYTQRDFASTSKVKDNKWEETKTILFRVFDLLITSNMFTVTSKQNEQSCWHFFLVDWDKEKKYLELTESRRVLDLKDYGKILDCGFGIKAPQDIIEKHSKTIFYLIRLDDCVETYYVAADVDKKLEMESASSVEEIRHCGQILYSSSDEDPAEALIYMMKQEYYGTGSGIILRSESPIDGVVSGGVEKVNEYLNAGLDVNIADRRGWTLLHHFAQCNDVNILRLIKSKEADIHRKDKVCGRKPVLIAAREGHIDAIEFFLDNGASVNDADENNWTLAHYAAWNGNKDTIKFLIQKGANIKAKESTVGKMAIHIAAEYGHTDVVKLLREEGANIEDEDDSGRTPLYYAAWAARFETAKELIDMGAEFRKPNKIGSKPIHSASLTNCTEIIELFLVNDESVNEPDGKGHTPLHRAVLTGYLEVVQFLVDKNANLNAVDKNGYTPFSLSERHPDVAIYLAGKLGMILKDEEKYSDAHNIYSKLHEIQKKQLGPNHPEALETRNTLAYVLYKQSRYDEAVATFKEVLKDREKYLGSNRIETLCTKHGLGLVYRDQIKYDEALEIFKEVLEKREATLGANHHDTLNVARDIANIHFQKGEFDLACNIFKDVYARRRAAFGVDHVETLRVSEDLAIALVNKGEYKTALETLKDVFQKRKDTLGVDHPETFLTKHHISMISQNFEVKLKEQQGCLIQ